MGTALVAVHELLVSPSLLMLNMDARLIICFHIHGLYKQTIKEFNHWAIQAKDDRV